MLRAVSLAEACDRPTKHLRRPRILPLRLFSSPSHFCLREPDSENNAREFFLRVSSPPSPCFVWILPRACFASANRQLSSIYIRNFYVCRSRIRRTPATRTRDAHINTPFASRPPLCVFLARECKRSASSMAARWTRERGSFNVG